MSAIDSTHPRPWFERLAPLGALVFALLLLIGFFTSDDYGDTPASVVEYADTDKTHIYLMALLGLATPLLMGLFVGALVARIPRTEEFLRPLVGVSGAVFIALMVVGMTIWSAPLLEDDLSESTASVYLALDDFGWVIIGTAGVAMGLMIVGASLAALRLGVVPSWLGWLGVALGVVAFASVAAVGLFAWLAWLVVAAVLMLLRPERAATALDTT